MLKKIKDITIVGLVFSIVFSFLAPGVNASANTQNNEDISEESVQELANELQFYFEEVGYINEDHEYIITDEDAFIQNIQEDINITDLEINTNDNTTFVQSTGVVDFGVCVVVNSVPFGGVAWEIANATTELDGFFDALTALNFELASEMMLTTASQYLSDAAFQELSNVSLVANIATSVATCGLGI
jgi:hypothetical protein